MVYRLSWVAGAGAVLLALLRLDRLLRPTAEGLPWQLVLLIAIGLGAAITWVGTAYRLDGRLVAVVNLVAAVIAAIRIAVPSTTWFVFPTLSSFAELRLELEFAREVIRAGVAPVAPLAGVVAILALIFWGLGGLLVWGLHAGRPYVAVLTPLVVYLQFATMDRDPGGWWLWLFLVFLGAALLAVSLDRRRHGTGLLTSSLTRTAVPRTRSAAAVVALVATLGVAVGTAQAAGGLVPRTGLLEWRVRSGLTGDYFGSISFNPFVGIRQDLVSGTNVALLTAKLAGDPTEPLYWRLVALESFDGEQWFTDDPDVRAPEDLDSYENRLQAFRGPTDTVVQDVTILFLDMGWLPAAYAPIRLTAEDRSIELGFRVKDDASLRFDPISFHGMAYTVVSEVPRPDLDVLARGPDGLLSPLFRNAADQGLFPAGSEQISLPTPLDLPEAYLSLPAGMNPGIGQLAGGLTSGLATDFEKGLALEAFFRRPGEFTYSTQIQPGHSAEDLAAWLLDRDSPNHRTGYCEQFATSMAVMARLLDIPSRVVLGFTPGGLLDDGRIVVRDRNAHAWVELWMPTQGWVRFDPTPRGDGSNPATGPFDIDEILSLADSDQADPDGGGTDVTLPPRDRPFPNDGPPPPPPATGSGFSVPLWLIATGGGLLLVLGSVPLLKWTRHRRRLGRLSVGEIPAAWQDVLDRLDDLGIRPPGSATPAEVAASIGEEMAPLAAVYGAAAYGDPRRMDPDAASVAGNSLTATRRSLNDRSTRRRRLIAQYRLRSLLPARLKYRPGT